MWLHYLPPGRDRVNRPAKICEGIAPRTLGFLAKISFTPLLYQPGRCLGCPENRTSSRNYNLFGWFPKWNDIQKSYENYQNPLKSYCFFLNIFKVCSILAGKQRPKPIRPTKVDHTASFDTQAIPRGEIIVEILWFLHFFLRFLTCGAT
jgi:hypothetical protein